jgi:hypothetical protein
MLRFAVEVAVRGLTGTAEGADSDEETGSDPLLESEIFTAPAA